MAPDEPSYYATFENDGCTFVEFIQQPYQDGVIGAGMIHGHPEDTVYLRLARNGENPGLVLALRPDELAALLWVGSGVMYSMEMGRLMTPASDMTVEGDTTDEPTDDQPRTE